MKPLLLTPALLLAACQGPQRTAERAAVPIEPAPAPIAAAPAAEDAPALPRWTHSDRAEHAVRAWVRDLR